MILVTLGCSFVQGVAPPNTSDPFRKYCKRINYTIDNFNLETDLYHSSWPNLLNNEFEQVINLGKQNRGNGYIQRLLLKFLTSVEQSTLNRCVFIISWSLPVRREYLIDNQWHQIYMAHSGCAYTHSNLIGNSLYRTPKLDNAVQIYLETMHRYEQDLFQTYLIRLATESIFKRFNVNQYLETALMQLERLDEKYDSSLINMYNTINKDNQILDVGRILNYSEYTHDELHYSCGHPNELGNQLLADYYIKSIKDRGWV